MQQPIRKNELAAHTERLREIFGRRVEAKHGEIFPMSVNTGRDGRIHITLQKNSATESVVNDQDREEVCAVLKTLERKRVLCSYFESWQAAGRERFIFDNTSMTFFLVFQDGEVSIAKQMFRLEWENWHSHRDSTMAAYPHWQFDRWLTASDTRLLEELRTSFEAPPAEPLVFGSADEQTRSNRPDLGWFTKVHFPVIAPWAKTPIVSMDDISQPHRTVPETVKEVEDWVASALWYVRSELTAYAMSA